MELTALEKRKCVILYRDIEERNLLARTGYYDELKTDLDKLYENDMYLIDVDIFPNFFVIEYIDSDFKTYGRYIKKRLISH